MDEDILFEIDDVNGNGSISNNTLPAFDKPITSEEMQKVLDLTEKAFPKRESIDRIKLPSLPRYFGYSRIETAWSTLSILIFLDKHFLPYWLIEDKKTHFDGTSKCTALVKEGSKSLVLYKEKQ